LAHFNREIIPEQVVHARGIGAYGYFTLAKSLSQYFIADFSQHVGDKLRSFCASRHWVAVRALVTMSVIHVDLQ